MVLENLVMVKKANGQVDDVCQLSLICDDACHKDCLSITKDRYPNRCQQTGHEMSKLHV